jgi:hypothetical protein
MSRRFVALLLGLSATLACISNDSSPSPQTLNLVGTWSGDISAQNTTARMTWELTQSGTAVNGPILIRLPNGIVLVNGALTGTVAGNALTYKVIVSPGGIPSAPACTGEITGSVNAVSNVTLQGSYTVVSSSCATGLPGGSFTLTKG